MWTFLKYHGQSLFEVKNKIISISTLQSSPQHWPPARAGSMSNSASQNHSTENVDFLSTSRRLRHRVITMFIDSHFFKHVVFTDCDTLS
jgi:hypothetical protein